MKILIVLTSHRKFGDTGNPTGFWLEELASPYYAFKDAGHAITLASPKGGRPPVDPTSASADFMTESAQKFSLDVEAQELLNTTLKLEQVRAQDYDAVFYPGGHGPLWDLAENQFSLSLISSFNSQGKYVAAVCHGTAVLLNAKRQDGTYLIRDTRITGFTDNEEDQVGASSIVPFSIEVEAKKRGARFSKSDSWSSYAISDGLVITGQNPQSSEATAELLLKKLRVSS